VPFQPPTNEQKDAVWQAYREGRPTRVPMMLVTNPRVFLMNPRWNTFGYTFEQAATDPLAHINVALHHQLYLRTELNQYCDLPTGLPDQWEISLNIYNVYEAAALGAAVRYPPDQVPDTEPFLTDDNRESIFDVDIDHPLDLPFIRDYLAFWHEMDHICQDLKFEGRPVKLFPFSLVGTDGPLTVACNIRGSEFLLELVTDEDYAQRLMEFLTQFAINRRNAFAQYWDNGPVNSTGLADDCCQMISLEDYREKIMPLHRKLYEHGEVNSPRRLHMCGNVQHLLPAIHEELGVTGFDTGFPIDHGKLRRDLGNDVEVQGGTEIALLLNGSPDEVYQRTRDILTSGIMDGGKFTLREGNNLPPNCPADNLEAMYTACLGHGHYHETIGDKKGAGHATSTPT